MPKRGENIHKRKDGRWEGRYIRCRDDAGRAKYSSVYGKTYGEVKAKLMEIAKSPPSPRSSGRRELTFQEVLSLWIRTNHIRYKGATESKYQYMIDRHIAPELGKIKITKLTALTINTFLENKLESGRIDQSGGLSAAYVRSMMLIINSAMRYAVDEGIRPPLNTPIYRPKIVHRELAVLSVSDQKRLESYLYRELNPTRLGILISLHAGLRIGEVCALAWDDVDLTENIIHVRSTVARTARKEKNGKMSGSLSIDIPKTASSVRDIPIFSELRSALITMKQCARSPYVVSDSASFLSPRTYEYRYHKLLEQSGVEPVNYHALRHTFATRCIEVGVDVKSLSEMLGHANTSITLNTYVHSSMEQKRRQIEKLASLSA